MKSLLIAILLGLTSQSLAGGGESGGGGKVALCTEPNGTKRYRLMDYVRAEGPEWQHMTLVPGQGADEYEIAKSIVDRVYQYSPMIRSKLLQAIEHFRTNQVIYYDHQFFMVLDSNEDALPNNCTGPFMAIKQKAPQNVQEKYFRINAEIWNSPLLSLQDKAGLIIHEVVLRDLRDKTSDRASFYNAYITSTLMDTRGKEGFEQLMRDTPLYHLTDEIFGREDVSIRLHPENAVTHAQELPTSIYRGYMTQYFSIHKLEIGEGVYGKGLEPTHVKINGVPVTLEGRGSISFDDKTQKIKGTEFGYNEHEQKSDSEMEKSVQIQGKTVTALLKGKMLGFDEKGLVARATLKADESFQDGSGRTIPIPSNQEVFFIKGKLTHVGLVRDVNAGKNLKDKSTIVCDKRVSDSGYYWGRSVTKLEIDIGFDKDENLYSVLLKRKEDGRKEWVSFSTITKPLLEEYEGNELAILNASFDDLVKTRISRQWTSKCVLSGQYWFWSYCIVSIPILYRPDDPFQGVEAGDLVLKARRLPSKKEKSASKKKFELDITHTAMNRRSEIHSDGSVSGKFLCHWK